MSDKYLILKAAEPLMAGGRERNEALERIAREMDASTIRIMLNIGSTKIDYKSGFKGECVLFSDDLKTAYYFFDIPEEDIFEEGCSVEVHGWGSLEEYHYRDYIKEFANTGVETSYADFKESLDMKYRLKIGNKYISGDAVIMGIPDMSTEIGGSLSFTYDEAVSKMNMICFEAKMIEI